MNIKKGFWVRVHGFAWMWTPWSACEVQFQHTSPAKQSPIIPSTSPPLSGVSLFWRNFCVLRFYNLGRAISGGEKKSQHLTVLNSHKKCGVCLCLGVPQRYHLTQSLLLKRYLSKTIRAKLLKPGLCTTFYKLAKIHRCYSKLWSGC